MTKRERFQAFAAFERVDRPPRYVHFVDACLLRLTAFLGRNPYEAFDMDLAGGAGLRPPDGFQFPDYEPYHPGRKVGQEGFTIDGNGVRHINHGFYHFTEYVSPLRDAASIDELERYPIASNATWLDDALIASDGVMGTPA